MVTYTKAYKQHVITNHNCNKRPCKKVVHLPFGNPGDAPGSKGLIISKIKFLITESQKQEAGTLSKEPLRRCDICGEVATIINPVARTRKNGLDQSCRRCDKFYKENQEKYGAFQRMPDHKEWCPVFLGLEN